MDVSARSQDTFGGRYHERIAHSKTTHDHALRRGTYRSKRRRGGGAFSGWRLALPSGLFAIIIATGALMVLGAGAALAFFAGDLPSPQDIAKDPLAQSTKVYDQTGTELLYQFSEENREVVSYQDIPQVLIDATVSAEDKTFWTNPGVDIVGTIRAVISDLTHSGSGQGGASTITQQLVKQRIVGNEVSIKRKIREAILAVEVTNTYSKQQILELYFNQIYYGNQAYGVKAAPQTYFGKSDLSKLTLAEAALLAGLPQAPSVLDPTQADNVDRAAERRAYVLGQMVDNGAITQAESDAASAEEIKVAGPPVATIKAPHFVFQVRNQLAQILGGDEAAVSRGGYRVTTTLDMKTQEIGERQVREWVDLLHNRNVWNAALVSIDPRTGEVLTYVGSVDYNNRDDPRVQGQFDVAGIGLRQPGSSFKMFNYVTALKKGATAATVVVDARTDFGAKADPTRMSPAACGYCPENADLQYHGPVTMRQAIRESRNVPAVKFLAEYSGIEDTIQTASDLGITTPIDPATIGLSLTLGAKEVHLVDFASATGPGQLWRDYMKEALADTPATDWPRPANVVSGTVVSAPGAYGGYGSGLAPSALSPFSMTEWFIKGTEPAKTDDWFVAGCPQPDGSAKVAMRINDTRAPAPFQRYTDQWIRDAIAGKHAYSRYTWNLVGPDPCPTPTASLTPVPTRTPVPKRTPGGTPTLPPFPTPTPKKT